MRKQIRIKRGLDLRIAGAVTDTATVATVRPGLVAVVPDDFRGFTPKLEVKEGYQVKQGEPLLHDKTDDAIKVVAPVAGTVKAVVRGARRKIERIVIEAAENDEAVTLDFDRNDATAVAGALKQSGLWARMRRRPFDTIPLSSDRPRDIFVTAFDSAPLAADMALALENRQADLEAGVKALSLLTDGKIYISLRNGQEIDDVAGATMVEVSGPHPAGNAGIQAANISPVAKGECIWTLDAVTLARIGRLMTTGHVDTTTLVAVTGPEVKNPNLIATIEGAAIGQLIADNTCGGNLWIVSGNLLTGSKVDADGYLRFPYRQISVISDGSHADEFMGWASFSMTKMSESRSFPSHFLGKRLFRPDARLNGGRRAMIMSGVYDSVLPMDILPEYLFKAIIARDFERMEQLGIYEIAPEDVALCEYIDPSKLELQKLVAEGLDYMISEEA